MATNLETIESALRRIGVLDIEESATARQGVIGLRLLNQMLTRWEASNIPLGFTAQTHLSASIPVPDEAQAAVENNLAIECGPDFGVTPPQAVIILADSGLAALMRDAFVVTPNDLSNMPGGRGRFNINSGD